MPNIGLSKQQNKYMAPIIIAAIVAAAASVGTGVLTTVNRKKTEDFSVDTIRKNEETAASYNAAIVKSTTELEAEIAQLNQQQKNHLERAISALQAAGVNGWKDEIESLSSLLSNKSFTTRADNYPHAGARILSSRKKEALAAAIVEIDGYNRKVPVLLATVVALGEKTKSSTLSTNTTGSDDTRSGVETWLQENQNTAILIAVAISVLILIYLKQRR